MSIRFVEDPRLAEIAALKARIAELERLLLTVNTAIPVSSAVNKLAADRNAYMRDYMRRRRALKNKNSTPI